MTQPDSRINSDASVAVAAPVRAPHESVQTSAAIFLPILLLLAATHFLVDMSAGIISPLWPALETHIQPPVTSIMWIYVIWTTSTSFGQVLFGFLADKIHGRWLLWGGPLVAVICMSSLGLTTSAIATAILIGVGGLGIAAFHPEAAAVAGGCSENRSRAVSIFAMGGYFGQAVGPGYSGWVTDRFGMSGLAWGIFVGLAVLGMLIVVSKVTPQPIRQSPKKKRVVADAFAGKHGSLSLLIVVSLLRVAAIMGVTLALAFVLDARQKTNAEIGLIQSAFMVGISAGGLSCAMLVHHRNERFVMWFCSILAAPFLFILPELDGTWLALAVGISGLCLGVTLPILISYGQRLLPHNQRVASSLTMGFTWGLGGILVAGLMWVLKNWDRVEFAFAFLAIAAIVSGLLSFCLPKPRDEIGLAS